MSVADKGQPVVRTAVLFVSGWDDHTQALAILGGDHEETDTDGFIFDVATLEGWRILVVNINQPRHPAYEITQRVLGRYSPDFLLVVGHIWNAARGHIVLADQIEIGDGHVRVDPSWSSAFRHKVLREVGRTAGGDVSGVSADPSHDEYQIAGVFGDLFRYLYKIGRRDYLACFAQVDKFSRAMAFALQCLSWLPGVSLPAADNGQGKLPGQGYVSEFSIHLIRAVYELNWHCPTPHLPGWHVLVGVNGSGKSTILRSIALALLGRRETDALSEDWRRWLPSAATSGRTIASLSENDEVTQRTFGLWRPEEPEPTVEIVGEDEKPADVFCIGYGPFRRFTGGDADLRKRLDAFPRSLRLMTLFREEADLADSLAWLKDLRFKELEGKPEGFLREAVSRFINASQLLPQGAQLVDISSDDVIFVDGNECKIPIGDLSDGFRSVLSLVLDVIRHLAQAFGPRHIFGPDNPGIVKAWGIMLVDEIDVHLHPSWQQKIGGWFKKHFPNFQFIIATHSLLVCQSADSVFLLPEPGSSDLGGHLDANALNQIRYGTVLDGYGTGVFGRDVDQSKESRHLTDELAQLNIRQLDGILSADDKARQRELRRILPTGLVLSSEEPVA